MKLLWIKNRPTKKLTYIRVRVSSVILLRNQKRAVWRTEIITIKEYIERLETGKENKPKKSKSTTKKDMIINKMTASPVQSISVPKKRSVKKVS